MVFRKSNNLSTLTPNSVIYDPRITRISADDPEGEPVHDHRPLGLHPRRHRLAAGVVYRPPDGNHRPLRLEGRVAGGLLRRVVRPPRSDSRGAGREADPRRHDNRNQGPGWVGLARPHTRQYRRIAW